MNKNKGGAILSVVASDELLSALDAAAASHGETRSLRVRKVLAKYLRDAGHLKPKSPTTRHEANRLASQKE